MKQRKKRKPSHFYTDYSDFAGGEIKWEWIQGEKGKKGYIRLECAGGYVGSPSERQMRKLYGWLKGHFAGEKR